MKRGRTLYKPGRVVMKGDRHSSRAIKQSSPSASNQYHPAGISGYLKALKKKRKKKRVLTVMQKQSSIVKYQNTIQWRRMEKGHMKTRQKRVIYSR